jgi:hypothetical protein
MLLAGIGMGKEVHEMDNNLLREAGRRLKGIENRELFEHK